jgi:hypothetical protein
MIAKKPTPHSALLSARRTLDFVRVLARENRALKAEVARLERENRALRLGLQEPAA